MNLNGFFSNCCLGLASKGALMPSHPAAKFLASRLAVPLVMTGVGGRQAPKGFVPGLSPRPLFSQGLASRSSSGLQFSMSSTAIQAVSGCRAPVGWRLVSKFSFGSRLLASTSASSASSATSPAPGGGHEQPHEEQAQFGKDQRAMGFWLLGCAGLVFAMVVVGGITRLTESGLSMTEWRPLLGAVPPQSAEEWDALFERYKQFPEYKKLRDADMSLDDFKRIFFWEYGHRLLGRVIGVAFAVPMTVFVVRGSVSRRLGGRLVTLFALGGAQGLVGWWMVKSGLDDRQIEARDGVPRVSHFRLCFHLTTAFVIYAGLLSTALTLLRPGAGGPALVAAVTQAAGPAAAPRAVATLARVRVAARVATAAAAATAASGALVAGLDAGLVYNEWPLMGGQLVPADGFSQTPWWRNMTSNSSLVQFEHRTLAYFTVATVAVLQLVARRGQFVARYAPKPVRLALVHVGAMVVVQATLGIMTLIHFVPVHLAATHQAGSLSLLTFCIWLLHEVRRKVPRL